MKLYLFNILLIMGFSETAIAQIDEFSFAHVASHLTPGSRLTFRQIEKIGGRALEKRIPSSVTRDTVLLPLRVWKDRIGMGHLLVQQTYHGIPVAGAQAIVHVRRDGTVFHITDNLKPEVHIDPMPLLTSSDAISIAITADGDCTYREAPTATLVIQPAKDEYRLVYRVRLNTDDSRPDEPVYSIDANTAEILGITNASQSEQGTGIGFYNAHDFALNTTTQKDDSYVMEDLYRQIGVFDARGRQWRYDLEDLDNRWGLGGEYVPVDDVPDEELENYYRKSVDVAYGLAFAHDYYLDILGIQGLLPEAYVTTAKDGTTRLLDARSHFAYVISGDEVNPNLAGWKGSTYYFYFGAGDGVNYGPWTTLDIIGHEWTHAVIQGTNLSFFDGSFVLGETGALNESWADVFGEMVENYERSAVHESENDWKVGMIRQPPEYLATRDLAAPHNVLNDEHYSTDTEYYETSGISGQPDHYEERYIGSFDNGGSHMNNGIANHAFYLLSEGGCHAHTGECFSGKHYEIGLGRNNSSAIWFHALNFMTNSTDFSGAREATHMAAETLLADYRNDYPTIAEIILRRVDESWSLVGVLPPSTCSGCMLDGECHDSLSWVEDSQGNCQTCPFNGCMQYICSCDNSGDEATCEWVEPPQDCLLAP